MTDRYDTSLVSAVFCLFVYLFVCDMFEAARFRVVMVQYLCLISCTVNLAIVLHLFNKPIDHGKTTA